MSSFLGRLVVNFVLCLICFIAYSSQIFIIWPWYGSVLSIELLAVLVPFKYVTNLHWDFVNPFRFSVFVGLLLWNYFLCVYTDPGHVPDGYVRFAYLLGFLQK